MYQTTLNRKRTLWNSQTDCQDAAPLTGTRFPQTKHLCLTLSSRTHSPRKTKMESSKHNEAICVRDAGQESAIFLEKFSGQEVYMDSPKGPHSQNSVMHSPFCSWTVRFAFFWRGKNGLQLTTLKTPKAWLLFRPNFCWCSRRLPWAYVSLD